MYTVHRCTVYIVQSTVCSGPCIIYTVQFTVWPVEDAAYPKCRGTEEQRSAGPLWRESGCHRLHGAPRVCKQAAD